jgi:protein gp37
MADHSAIEWTEATWNPVTGCTRVSPGCDHCYIERTIPFRLEKRSFTGPHTGATTGVRLHLDRLDRPKSWRRPRRIFVNSLSDLFHEQVPDQFVYEVLDVMEQTPRHTYQVLTKRHARMRSLLTLAPPAGNVWVGVSVEDQTRAAMRVPVLRDTPAAVRWLSCEPLLGPVDIRAWLTGLAWIVVGGESGPDARPMELDWARSLVQQCQAAGVPVFVKQLGSHWGRDHHDIEAFPPELRVREYPDRTGRAPVRGAP